MVIFLVSECKSWTGWPVWPLRLPADSYDHLRALERRVTCFFMIPNVFLCIFIQFRGPEILNSSLPEQWIHQKSQRLSWLSIRISIAINLILSWIQTIFVRCERFSKSLVSGIDFTVHLVARNQSICLKVSWFPLFQPNKSWFSSSLLQIHLSVYEILWNSWERFLAGIMLSNHHSKRTGCATERQRVYLHLLLLCVMVQYRKITYHMCQDTHWFFGFVKCCETCEDVFE